MPSSLAMTDRDIVQSYFDLGLQPVFWPAIDDWKGPREEDWETRKYTIADYHDGDRVGIRHGVEARPGQFVIDVDIDWAEGAKIARALLPATRFVWGRSSKEISHCLYLSPDVAPWCEYKDIDDKTNIDDKNKNKTIIELRAHKHQSMAPPSIWQKDGKREPLTFRANSELTPVASVEALKQRCCLAAIGMLLAKHLGHNGFGHDARLAWAGWLLRRGISADDLITMGEAMSAVCNNREISDVRSVVESTEQRLRNKEKKVKGGPALAKIIGGDKGKQVIARVHEWLGLGDAEGVVVMRGGDLTSIVDRAEEALRDSHIYQRGGVLTRVITLDASVSSEDIRRAAGSTILTAVKEPWLVEQMGQALEWHKVRATGEHVKADPAPVYARTLLGRGQWSFPILRGVVTAPTLARDGRIIEKPGFDADSGLLVAIPTGLFRPIPQAPTKDDATDALKRLEQPIRKFPFIDDSAAKSVALSAFLTALVRLNLRTAPLHGFDAPTAGTGKSMLAEMVGLLATGCLPPAMSQGKSEEEDEKRLSTILFAGDPVIHIDNCERAVSGDFLCSMLTQEIVQARILGQSERRVLPSTALVLASGNNLSFLGDASRRAVVCRLDAKEERPDTREFDFDCRAEVLTNRPSLVVDGLTILRAYHVAGRPQPEKRLTPMGSFTDWEFVRGALVWLGQRDPADTRISILDSDPRRNELLSVMHLWSEAIGDTPIDVSTIKTRADKAVEDKDIETPITALRDKLVDVTSKQEWSGRSVGRWLKRNMDRVIDGKCFRCESGRVGAQWRLDGMKEPSAPSELFEQVQGVKARDEVPF